MSVGNRRRPLFVYSERPIVLKILAFNSAVFSSAALAFPNEWKGAMSEMVAFSLLYTPILMILIPSRKIESFEQFMTIGSLNNFMRRSYREIESCCPHYSRNLVGKVSSFDIVDGMQLKLSGRKDLISVKVNPVNQELGASLYNWTRQKMERRISHISSRYTLK